MNLTGRPATATRPGRATALRHLAALAQPLGADEVRVLCLLAERLVAGRATYGALALARDRRDFRREATEELLDATFYLAADLLSGRGAR